MPLAAIALSDIAAGSGGFVLHGEDADDRAGASVASAGDINGDGLDDLVIGARFGDGAGNAVADAGDAYVVFGQAAWFLAGWTGSAIDLAAVAGGTGGFVIHGEAAGERAGRSVAAAGDINGDGFADLLIGADSADGAGSATPYAGDTYVLFGHGNGFGTEIALADIAAGQGGFVIHGEDAADRSGFSVASAGDFNGDGYADIIIGAPGARGAGNAAPVAGDSYVVFGRAAGGFGATVDLAAIAAGSGGFVLHGEDIFDFSGISVASAGDINGDGFDDLIIGADRAGGVGNTATSAGDSYVVFGHAGPAGPVNLAAIAAGTGGFVIHGQDANDHSGASVAPAGDVNGDGLADLVIGAWLGDAAGNARTDAGDSYVVFGRREGFGAALSLSTIAAGGLGFVIHGEDGDDQSGCSVASAGDINGDGIDDLIIGASGAGGAGNVAPLAGDSYVVFGRDGGFGAPVELSGIAAGIGGFVIRGEDAGDASGASVASAGDLNGDGFDDLLIGAPMAAGAGNATDAAGDVYVVFGRDFSGTVTASGTAEGDALDGGAGLDRMVGGLGDDILRGHGGRDALLGGAGDDVLVVPDLAFLRVDGGSGIDTLALTGSGGALDLAELAGGRLRGIERIDLTGSGNDTMRLAPLDVLRMSATGNSLRVDGGAGDLVSLGAEWTRGAGAEGYTSYTAGAAEVRVGGGACVAYVEAGTRALAGGTGDDMLQGEAGDDLLEGAAGNDTLIGGPDGDAGTDTAVMRQARAASEIRYDPATRRTTVISTGSDGVDTLEGVERIRFDDRTIDIAGADGTPRHLFAVNVALPQGGSAERFLIGAPFSGAIDGVTDEFILATAENIVMASTLPNAFIRLGSGNDAVAVASGHNIIDGSTGSNFLTGGSGQDIFFVDARGGGFTWDTINNFGIGDAVTLWGYTDGISTDGTDKAAWHDNQGAPGFEGLTIHARLDGQTIGNGSITFAGLGGADRDKLLVLTGSVGGNDYLYLTRVG